MNETLTLPLIEVSPLVLLGKKNNNSGGKSYHFEKFRQSISSPLVKLSLYSKSLGVIWDKCDEKECDLSFRNISSKDCCDYPNNFTDESKRKIRKFEILQGTAYLCNESRINRADKQALIQRVKMELRNDVELRTTYEKEASWIRLHDTVRRQIMVLPTVAIPSENPSDVNGIPCLIRVYACSNRGRKSNCKPKDASIRIVDGSMVQVLPPTIAIAIDRKLQTCCVLMQSDNFSVALSNRPQQALLFAPSISLEDLFLGVSELQNGPKEAANDIRVLSHFEPETTKSLTFRMKALLKDCIFIGTTKDAFYREEKEKKRINRLHKATSQYWGENMSNIGNIRDTRDSSISSVVQNLLSSKNAEEDFCCHGALTVYDPTQRSGKSSLVTAIARSVLNCRTYVLNGSVLFGKYGSSCADAALESTLHQIVMRAAVRGRVGGGIGSVCIILDHLDTFVPSNLGGRGDPSSSALSANSK